MINYPSPLWINANISASWRKFAIMIPEIMSHYFREDVKKNRRPLEYFAEDLKAQVKVETIFLVTDPEHPGLILSFTNEDVCIHYCVTNQCTYTQIPLYKV